MSSPQHPDHVHLDIPDHEYPIEGDQEAAPDRKELDGLWELCLDVQEQGTLSGKGLLEFMKALYVSPSQMYINLLFTERGEILDEKAQAEWLTDKFNEYGFTSSLVEALGSLLNKGITIDDDLLRRILPGTRKLISNFISNFEREMEGVRHNELRTGYFWKGDWQDYRETVGAEERIHQLAPILARHGIDAVTFFSYRSLFLNMRAHSPEGFMPHLQIANAYELHFPGEPSIQDQKQPILKWS